MQPRAYLFDQLGGDLRRRAFELQLGEEVQRAGHGQVGQLADAHPAHAHCERLRAQAFAAAHSARVVGEEVCVVSARAFALRFVVEAFNAVGDALVLRHPPAPAPLRAKNHRFLRFLGQLVPRRVQVRAGFVQHLVKVALHVARAPVHQPPKAHRAFAYGQRGIGHQRFQINFLAQAQAAAGFAHARGVVEREHLRRQLFVGNGALGAGELKAEHALFAAVGVQRVQDAVALAQRCLHRFGKPRTLALFNAQAVNDDFNVVLSLLVQRDFFFQRCDAPVHAHARETRRARRGEHVLVFTLAPGDYRREQVDAAGFGVGEDAVHDVVHGLLAHRLAALHAMLDADARVKHAQVVVDFGDSADGGARVMAGGALLNGDSRGEAGDVLHFGLVKVHEELARVAAKRFEVAALAFGVKRVKRERRLAAAGHAGEDDELLARQLHLNVLEVVHLCAANVYELLSHKRLSLSHYYTGVK